MTTDTKPTLAQLEERSNAVCDAFDIVDTQLGKVRTLIAALVLVEDAATDDELPIEARRVIGNIDWTTITALKKIEADMVRNLDRLEAAKHEAARALNSADEAA